MLEGQQETASMHGRLRNVSVVEYQGEKFVIKILKQVEGERHMAMHVDMHNREVLTLDAVSAEGVPWFFRLSSERSCQKIDQ